MASGSLPVTLKIHKFYVRGADEVINIRDSFKRLCGFPTEDLSKRLIKTSDGILLMPNGVDLKNDQSAKADAGKLPLTLVPLEAIEDIAEIRRYGCMKYKDPDNWKRVKVERYRDALFRHLIAYLRDPQGVDEESGLEHYKHLITNAAFICALERKAKDGKKM